MLKLNVDKLLIDKWYYELSNFLVQVFHGFMFYISLSIFLYTMFNNLKNQTTVQNICVFAV